MLHYVVLFYSEHMLGIQDTKMNRSISPLEYLAVVLKLGISLQ